MNKTPSEGRRARSTAARPSSSTAKKPVSRTRTTTTAARPAVTKATARNTAKAAPRKDARKANEFLKQAAARISRTVSGKNDSYAAAGARTSAPALKTRGSKNTNPAAPRAGRKPAAKAAPVAKNNQPSRLLPMIPHRGSTLPSLLTKQKIWESLDINREGPHYSPSFRTLKLHSRGRGNNRQVSAVVSKAPSKSATKARKNKALKVIPLSGLCEVGRNMTAFEYGNDLIVVDCGVSFPDESQPGIDSVIPNMTYLFENLHKLRAVFITHGHEDHIGAISWLMARVDCPIYTTPLPACLIRNKLEDRGIKGKEKNIRVVRAGDTVPEGCFRVEYIHVNHSIADACALAIYTPVGTIVHSGDFKVDYTPINGGPIDLPRLATIGAQGVLLLMCESTNVERPGFSPSERVVGETFADLFAEARGRVIVATFSSNVYRIQQIIDAAERHNRKVALVGRSMQNVFRAADSLGYIQRREDTIIDLYDVDKYSDEELVIITTGSQGEPMAALTRMAFDEHRKVEIQDTDTVIISATPIPGNEKPIYRVINELYKKGAKVVYSSIAHIHVSGHAYREEIKLLHSLIQPKYFIPIHGEYRMLHIHAELAHELGQPWDSIFILNNGDVFQYDGQTADIVGSVPAEPVLIDGKSATTLDNSVLESRRILAEEGIVVISLAVNRQRQELAASPAFQTRGFVYQSDLLTVQNEASQLIKAYIKKVVNNSKPLAEMLRSNQFRDELASLFYQKTSRKPIVLVSVIEI